MLLTIHEFMLSVALFVEAVQWLLYTSIFSKAAEMCLTKEENVFLKVANLFSMLCTIFVVKFYYPDFCVASIELYYLKNDLLKKKTNLFIFFCPIVFDIFR